jgi:ATP-dependent Clp protease ATP-binding subunit ClpC
MYDRLSAQGLEALNLAEEEARAMGHAYLGTEHLLLGLLGLRDTSAAAALRRLGVQPAEVRSETERILGPGEGSGPEPLPLTPLASRALEQTETEADAMGRVLATGEDLLLGLAEVRAGLAARILGRMDVSADHIRTELASRGGPRPDSRG